jgi:ABC-type transport system involved in cytochrome bd biosynthesis fused ATPase/permease subunit
VIVAVSGLSQITILDIFLSLLFTTAFAAILTVGYHDEFDEHLPSNERLEDAIEEWIKSTSWTQEDDNSDAQRTGLEENQLENQEQQEERKE